MIILRRPKEAFLEAGCQKESHNITTSPATAPCHLTFPHYFAVNLNAQIRRMKCEIGSLKVVSIQSKRSKMHSPLSAIAWPPLQYLFVLFTSKWGGGQFTFKWCWQFLLKQVLLLTLFLCARGDASYNALQLICNITMIKKTIEYASPNLSLSFTDLICKLFFWHTKVKSFDILFGHRSLAREKELFAFYSASVIVHYRRTMQDGHSSHIPKKIPKGLPQIVPWGGSKGIENTLEQKSIWRKRGRML